MTIEQAIDAIERRQRVRCTAEEYRAGVRAGLIIAAESWELSHDNSRAFQCREQIKQLDRLHRDYLAGKPLSPPAGRAPTFSAVPKPQVHDRRSSDAVRVAAALGIGKAKLPKLPTTFVPGGELEGGTCTIWKAPEPGRSYSLGLDFAWGIVGKDWDEGVMLDDTGEQVLSISGHWGTGFTEILVPVLDAYGPFVVGEWSVTGLDVLRKLYDKGYWLYFDRDAKTRGDQPRDQLGHVPVENDPPVLMLRSAIGPRGRGGELLAPRIVVRCEELHQQLCRFGYRPKKKNLNADEATDKQLKYSAPEGEHDDKVRACALAVAGLSWLPLFARPRPKYDVGTLGHMLGHNEADDEPDRKRYWRRHTKQGARR